MSDSDEILFDDIYELHEVIGKTTDAVVVVVDAVVVDIVVVTVNVVVV